MGSMKASKLGVLGLVALMIMLGGFADSASAQFAATSPTAPLTAGSADNTITIVLSGIDTAEGGITVEPPAGWVDLELADDTAAGYTTGVTAYAGTAGDGSLVDIDPTAETLTLVYGTINVSTGNGGVTAHDTVGTHTFTFIQMEIADDTTTLATATVDISTEAVGSGAVTPASTVSSGGLTGQEVIFTYTAVGNDGVNPDILNNGTFTLAVPNAFTNPSGNVVVAADVGSPTLGTTVISAGASEYTITVPITQMSGGDTFTITYSGITIPVNGSDDPTDYEFSSRIGFGANLDLLASGSPSVTANKAADGSGTVAVVSGASVEASSTGNSIVFRLTAAGTLSGGEVRIVVPAGWTAPQGSAGSAGYTSLSVGADVATLSFDEQKINIAIADLEIGETFDITYADVTAPSDLGTDIFTTYVVADDTVTEDPSEEITHQPNVTVQAADGSGTATLSPASTEAGSSTALAFTFTAAGSMDDGKVSVTIDSDWPAPSGNTVVTTSGSTGTPVYVGRTVTVPINNLDNSQQVVITYTADAPAEGGVTSLFVVKSQGTASGLLTQVGDPLEVAVGNAGDGTGTLAILPETAAAATEASVVTLTYTAAGTMDGGAVRLFQTTLADMDGEGVVAVESTGTIGELTLLSNRVIVPITSLEAGETVTFTYTVDLPTSAEEDFVPAIVGSMGSDGGGIVNLADESIDIKNAVDGTGTSSIGLAGATTIGTADHSSNAGSAATAYDIVFNPAGTMDTGEITVSIPAEFTSPVISTGAADADGELLVFLAQDDGTGADVASDGILGAEEVANGSAVDHTIFGRLVTIPLGGTIDDDVDATGSAHFVVVRYVATVGTVTGTYAFPIQAKSLEDGTLTDLAAQSTITVTNAADGSGTLAVTPAEIPVNTANVTIELVYTPAGPIDGGLLTFTEMADADWTKPGGTVGANETDEPGYVVVTALDSDGAAISGALGALTFPTQSNVRTLTVEVVSLGFGDTVLVEYGAGDGSLTAPGTAGNTYDFQLSVQGSADGALAGLAGGAETITVTSIEGSGTIAVNQDYVVEGSTNTYVFTYTAAAPVQAIEIEVPAGFTAPVITEGSEEDPGFTTTTAGTLGITGQTIELTGLTLAADDVVTITYKEAVAPGTAAAGLGDILVYTSATDGDIVQDPSNQIDTAEMDMEVFVVAAEAEGKVVAASDDDHTAAGGAIVIAGTARAAVEDAAVTFIYKPESFIKDGQFIIDLPAGLSAPTLEAGELGAVSAALKSDTDGAETDVTANLSVSGQKITLDIETLTEDTDGASNDDGYVSVTYSPFASPAAQGDYEADVSVRSYPSGALTTILNNEVIGGTGGSVAISVGVAESGSGTFTFDGPAEVNGGASAAFTFTYTAAGTMDGGQLGITEIAGFSAANVEDTPAVGFVTVEASAGATVAIAAPTDGVPLAADGSEKILIDLTTFAPGDTVTIIYGAGEDLGAVIPGTVGSHNFVLESLAGGDAFAAVGDPNENGEAAVEIINAADGSGTLAAISVEDGALTAAATGVHLRFTYTAIGAMDGGALRFTVPSGWTEPQGSDGVAGWVSVTGTASVLGTPEFSAASVVVPITTMAATQTIVLNYGDTDGAGAAAGTAVTPVAGDSEFSIQTRATADGTLTALDDAALTVAVTNAAAGTGSHDLTDGVSLVAGSTANEISIVFTAVGTMDGGRVSLTDSNTTLAAFTSDNITASASGGEIGDIDITADAITIPIVTLGAAETITIVHTLDAHTATGSGDSLVVGSDDDAADATVAVGDPIVITTTAAAPGSGTGTSNKTVAAKGGTIPNDGDATEIVFTYTAAGEIDTGGVIELHIASGWTAPTVEADADGEITVASSDDATVTDIVIDGQVVTVTVGVNELAATETVTFTYDKATAPDESAVHTFDILTGGDADAVAAAIASPIQITTTSTGDGSGSMVVDIDSIHAALTGALAFTYTAVEAITAGQVNISVPASFSDGTVSVTANDAAAADVTIASAVAAVVVDGTVEITVGTLAPQSQVVLTYADLVGPTVAADYEFVSSSQLTADGTMTNLDSSPTVTVTNAADGTGTASYLGGEISAGSDGNSLTFEFVPAGTMDGGEIVFGVPTDWTEPQGTESTAGYTVVTSDGSVGTPTFADGNVTIPITTLGPADKITIVYGSGSGSSGATAQTQSDAAARFTVQSAGASDGTATAIADAASTDVSVGNVRDGSGTLALDLETATAGNTVTLAFTYTPIGSIDGGQLSITTPDGWPNPDSGNTVAGVTAGVELGALSFSGATVTVPISSLTSGQSAELAYTVVVPSVLGTAVFAAKSQGDAEGTLVELDNGSPSLTVHDAADGSGDAEITHTAIAAASAANSLEVVFTAAGIMTDGATVSILVPSEFTPQSGDISPSSTGEIDADAATYVDGLVTIPVTSLETDETVTLVLTLDAPAAAGDYAFTISSTGGAGGTSTGIAAGPIAITVGEAADGSGSATASTTPDTIEASSDENTVTVVYTAVGTIVDGRVVVELPTGWSAVSANASSDDGASVEPPILSGNQIAVRINSMAADESVSIAINDVTSNDVLGPVTFNVLSRGSAAGSSTALAAGSPEVWNGQVVEITAISVAGSPGSAGDTITVSATGTAGQSATFSISGDLATDKAMTETESGSYSGEFVPVVDVHADGTYDVTVVLGPVSDSLTAGVVIETPEEPATPQFTMSIPAGTSLIHVPLAVASVDGVATSLESVGDLFDALGDAVNFLITHDAAGAKFDSYLGAASAGTDADRTLSEDLGIIAIMTDAAELVVEGDALGTDGVSAISLVAGLNLVGVPLEDPAFGDVSDLLSLEGASSVIVADGDVFRVVGAAGDAGDAAITGGQGYIIVAAAEGTTDVSGTAWVNGADSGAAPPLALTGFQSITRTPVLNVSGLLAEGNVQLRKDNLRLSLKNLTTGTSMSPALDDANRFGVTLVDLVGHAAQIGDVLELVAESPNPLLGIRPVHHVVTADDVQASRINMAELVAYEIPALTELLSNYPNPFNPETWIPFRLAEDASVSLTIYGATGELVRTIELGFTPAALYENKSESIYWDGRNEFGEHVASGIYFYHLNAGTFSATRKMVILK